ncbi:MAG: hypothetical protein KAI39_09975 [Desulfobulbaceae bacterium]|nr:hypothetical protein [Desulfobulbaceae bacterium]
MAGQVWGTSTLGGYMYADQLSDILRTDMQPMNRYQQFCDAKDATEKGLHEGETYNWNVYSDVATQGGTLTEGTAMPETNFAITQSSLTIEEFGNSVPYTGVLDDFSKQPVSEIIHKVLKNDATKAMEAAAHTQFDATLLTITPASGNSATEITVEVTGTPTATNAIALANTHVKRIITEMKERDIPTYDGDNYFALGRPASFEDFRDDLEAVHAYTDTGFQRILNGEVGKSYFGMRFFEQTAIASEGWSGAKSDAIHFFGEDTVAEAMVIPPEIRGKIPTDRMLAM